MNHVIKKTPSVLIMRGLMYTAAELAIRCGIGDEYLEFLETEIREYSPRSKEASVLVENAIEDAKRLLERHAS